MVSQRSIVVSGDLGSGKSTVSKELAKKLNIRRVSVGDLYRDIAQQRGMSALQLNLHSEIDDTVDSHVDQLQSQIAKSGEKLIVDSRLAWFFFTEAFKVFLITDPAVAARRVHSRTPDEVEAYSSITEAQERLRLRSESERVRFLTKYGADKARLRNYDLVCDTTSAAPDEVVDKIIAAYDGALGQAVLSQSTPLLLLDPCRIYPTQQIQEPGGSWEPDAVAGAGPSGSASIDPISIGYANSYFYVIDGHRRLSYAIRNGFKLVTARLLAEGEEEVADGRTAQQYFESEVSLSKVCGWAEIHKIELPLPPHLLRLASRTTAAEAGR